MDIYTVLKKDHDLVKGLFAKIEKLRDGSDDKKIELFNQLKQELTIHAEAEERTFYDALKNTPGIKTRINHAFKEHNEIKEILEKLTEMTETGDDWMNSFYELKELVEHHVQEEEEEIFSQAKELLDKNKEKKLAEQMLSEKEKLKEKEFA